MFLGKFFDIGTNRTKGIINSVTIMDKEIFSRSNRTIQAFIGQYKYYRIIFEGEVNFVREFGIWVF